MSQKPTERRSPFLPILLVGVLLSGGAFFWSNWQPKHAPFAGDSVAFAAPKPGNPKPGIRVRPATKAERASVVKTISTQLKAFNDNNWPEAVKYQSEGLKGNFPTPDAFGAMIVKVYPAFVHPKKVAFGKAFSAGGHIQIEVDLTGQDDSMTRAVYSLAKEKGNYRIESVMGGAMTPTDGEKSAAV